MLFLLQNYILGFYHAILIYVDFLLMARGMSTNSI